MNFLKVLPLVLPLLVLPVRAQSARSLLCDGRSAISSEEYPKAIALFSQVVKLSPNFSEAYFFRAVAHHQAKNLLAAVADYNQALALRFSERLVIYNNRGNALMQLGDYGGAIASLEKLLANAAYNNTRELELLATVYLMKGERQNAIAFLGKAAETYAQMGETSNQQLALDTINRINAGETFTIREWDIFGGFSGESQCP